MSVKVTRVSTSIINFLSFKLITESESDLFEKIFEVFDLKLFEYSLTSNIARYWDLSRGPDQD